MRDDRRHAQSRPVADPAVLAGLLGPVVRAAGMDLESVRVAAAGRRRLLRVVVDRDGGTGLADIADLSRAISARLDASDAMGDAPYTLEVSSPGVDRPLTEPRHWRRARGRLVAVPLAGARAASASSARTPGAGPAGAAREVTGRVVTVGEEGVTLDVNGHYREFAYCELGPGRVQVEFGTPGAGAVGVGGGDAGAAPGAGGGDAGAAPGAGGGGSADGH